MIPARSDHLAAMAQYAAVRQRLYGHVRPKLVIVPAVALPAPVEAPERIPTELDFDFIGPRIVNPVPIWRRILIDTARECGVSLNDIFGPSRYAPVVRARQLAMYRVRLETKWSYPKIGRLFGGRDHTTALHAIRKMYFFHGGSHPFPESI